MIVPMCQSRQTFMMWAIYTEKDTYIFIDSIEDDDE